MKKLGLFGDPSSVGFAALAAAAVAFGDRIYWRNRHGHKENEREGFPLVIVEREPQERSDAVVRTYGDQLGTEVHVVDGGDPLLAKAFYPNWESPSEVAERQAKEAVAAAKAAAKDADAAAAVGEAAAASETDKGDAVVSETAPAAKSTKKVS